MNRLLKTIAITFITIFASTGTTSAELEAIIDISRPTDVDGPIEVNIAVFIIDIDDIDSANQVFTANVFFKLTWYDSRLAHEGKKIGFPLNDVWNPHLQIVNQQKIWPTFPEIVKVFPDGKVVYRQRVWGQFSQPLDLRDFPFDQQHFDIHFISAGYDPDEIRFVRDKESPSGIAEKLSQADWTILEWTTEDKPYKPVPEDVNVAGHLFSIHAQRKTGYFTTKIIIPLVLIVIMSWVVFWIDPSDAGTQIGVAITSMLTLIAYRFAIGALLPIVSYVTRLDYFILNSTVLVFICLIEVVLTSTLAKRDKLKYARWIDYCARLIMPLIFAFVILKSFFL